MSAMDPQMEKLLVLQEREQRKMRLDRELGALARTARAEPACAK